MDDFEKYLTHSEARRNLKREKHFKLVSDTVGHDGRLLLELLSLKVAQRFNIDLEGIQYTPCYKLANHYILNDDINMDFVEWLYCEDAPFLKPLYEIGMFFPEFKGIAKNNHEIVDLANKVYGLDLIIDNDWYTEFVYCFSINFNKFIPIDFERVSELKQEIGFCRKYGLDYSSLKMEVEKLGLTVEKLMDD